MFNAILTRLTHALSDAIARGIEQGFRRGLQNVLGPLVEPEQLPAPVEDEPVNGAPKRKAVRS